MQRWTTEQGPSAPTDACLVTLPTAHPSRVQGSSKALSSDTPASRVPWSRSACRIKTPGPYLAAINRILTETCTAACLWSGVLPARWRSSLAALYETSASSTRQPSTRWHAPMPPASVSRPASQSIRKPRSSALWYFGALRLARRRTGPDELVAVDHACSNEVLERGCRRRAGGRLRGVAHALDQNRDAARLAHACHGQRKKALITLPFYISTSDCPVSKGRVVTAATPPAWHALRAPSRGLGLKVLGFRV
jgi:hypothetical protein